VTRKLLAFRGELMCTAPYSYCLFGDLVGQGLGGEGKGMRSGAQIPLKEI
jgi:hypothetical protein